MPDLSPIQTLCLAFCPLQPVVPDLSRDFISRLNLIHNDAEVQTMKERMTSISTLMAILLTLLGPSPSHAVEIYERYNGIRSLGMGGAYVTTVNDETALFSNPAGLGKVRDLFLTLVDPELHLSQDLTEIVDLENVGEIFKVQGLLDTLNQNKGKHFHAKAQLSPSIVLNNFGVGLLGQYAIDGEVDETGTTFDFHYTGDYMLSLGYNFRLFDGIIKLGFSGKLMDRTEVDQDFPATSTGLLLKDIASEGVGIATDVGIILTAPIRWLPSIGANVRDLGNTAFDLSDGMFYTTGTRRPATQMQKLDAGFALFPILGKGFRFTLTGEVHDIMTKDELEKKDIMRRVHGGIEINLRDFFFLRGGWNQKYYTAGLEFATERFQLQGATYGEDIGVPNAPREDRRYVAKFAVRF